jgi:hypothetical protein
MVYRLFGRRLRHRNNRYEGAAFGFGAVCDPTIDQGKKRVIFANADVRPCVPLGTALAHNDIAGKTALAAEKLHTEALASRVAPVARRSACLFVSHLVLLVFACLAQLCDEIITNLTITLRNRP